MDQSSRFISMMFDLYRMIKLFKNLFLLCCIPFDILRLICNLNLHRILSFPYGFNLTGSIPLNIFLKKIGILQS